MQNGYSPTTLYRMPWNLSDNAISWLEPTSKCNLRCDGCYRENRMDSHKSLETISHELDIFEKLRKTDSVSITGGEPLSHPGIIDIVRMVKEKGWKPVINTNGELLTKELLKELKKAGVHAFTIHIDSGQSRPHWKGKNELELNELRLYYARMIKEVKGVACSFNSTVYPETMKYIPEMVKWAHEHIDLVHILVFIIYRMAIFNRDFDFYAGSQLLNVDEVLYAKEEDDRRTDITAPEVVEEIRKAYPDFMPSAYLNGTAQSDSYKWLFAGRMGNKHQIFGYIGPKMMEFGQTVKHILTGSYLAYAKTETQRRGRAFFLMAPFDKGVRTIAKNYFKSLTLNPKAFFSKLHYQTVLIIQPIDFLPGGELNMCDGCPDMTVWNDGLVWSCRMEEQYNWGMNVHAVSRSEGHGTAS